MVDRLDATAKDWDAFQRDAVEFHLRNPQAWGDQRTGESLAEQVDPNFVHGPAALARSGPVPAAI